jgi:hypothetical protein
MTIHLAGTVRTPDSDILTTLLLNSSSKPTDILDCHVEDIPWNELGIGRDRCRFQLNRALQGKIGHVQSTI